MGKNHRHKKDLKADKAKVKLKQTKTKFLPKGLNITNTSFKIKPIVLAEQLKEKEQNVPLSKRKLDIKDILKRLKHHNGNVRCIACEELSSMFKIHSAEIIHHFFEIIPAISRLIHDAESNVRKATLKAINTILELTPTGKLETYSNYLSMHLACAMTNINRNMQEDSLLFLDCFITHNCGLIKKTSEGLLEDLFLLISILQSDSSVNRTLTLNLGSKMTSVAWRIKVLNTLRGVLESIYKRDMDDIKPETPTINVKSTNYCPLYKTTFLKVLTCTDIEGTFKKQSAHLNVDKHIATLVPLLYDTWLEVLPDKKTTKTDTEHSILKKEAASTLFCVVRILYLLWRYSEKLKDDAEFVKEIFLSTYGRKFMTNLVMNFPYCQNDASAKSKKKSLDNNRYSKCVKENIMICYIFFRLNRNMHSNTKHLEIQAITSYINTLQSGNIIRGTNIQYLFEILRACLVDNPYLWKNHGKKMASVLEHSVSLYKSHLIGDEYHMELMKILCDVTEHLYGSGILEHSSSILNVSFSRCPAYDDWLSSLPDLLCGPSIRDAMVLILLDFSRKNRAVFQKALLKKLPEVLENFDKLEIIYERPSIYFNQEVRMKHNILYMYLYIPFLRPTHKELLTKFVSSPERSHLTDFFVDQIKQHIER